MLELLKVAITSLSANRLRAVLTMFGVIWGIATVIILVSVINGFRVQNEKWFKDMGIDLLVLEYSHFYVKDGRRYPLMFNEEDADFLEASAFLVESAAPQIEEWREMQVGTKKQWFGLIATTAKIKDIRNYTLEEGRFISVVDEQNASKVVVIGSRVKEEFFGSSEQGTSPKAFFLPQLPPLGAEITISGVTFKVIGVLSPRVGMSDWAVIMPISTYKTSLAALSHGMRWGNMTVYAKLRDQQSFDEAVSQVKSILSARHGFDPQDEMALRVRDFSERRAEVNLLLVILFVITYTIGIITLAIGAVGVMSIMLVNVRERVREIGLRKAVGATSGKIVIQFLAEALTIMVIGGFIGIVLGILVVGLLAKVPFPEGFPTPTLTASTIYSAIIVNLLVGVCAGTYPALQAASLDPILALRSE